MKNRIIAICVALILALTLSACQLARKDGDIEAASDRLVGAFITKEHLDLFDFERYMNDNASKLINGGNINIDNDSRYNGRVYATLKNRIITSEVTGEQYHDWEYIFEELDGIPFFSALITAPDGNSFWGSASDSAISDGHMKIGDKNELEGTIYMTPRSQVTVYINPVYQSADGNVYLMAGSGISCSGVNDEGSVMSQTLEETYTITENGNKTESGTKVTVHVAVKNIPKLVRVIQMNTENTPVSQEEYKPEELPESIVRRNGTAYMIVETVSAASNGEVVARKIVEPTDGSFVAYTVRDDGICEGKYIQILWD